MLELPTKEPWYSMIFSGEKREENRPLPQRLRESAAVLLRGRRS